MMAQALHLAAAIVMLVCGMLAIPREVLSEVIQLEFSEIPELLRKQNLHVKAAELSKKAVEREAGFLERSYLPEVSASAGGETYKTGNQDVRNDPVSAVEASMNLYRGGRDSLEDKVVSKRIEIARIEEEQVFRFELTKARVAYWNLVSQREALKLLKIGLKSNHEQLLAARQRISSGLALKTDELEFQLYKEELEQNKSRIDLDIRNFELELATLLGFKDQTQIATAEAIVHEHSDELSKVPFMEDDHLLTEALELRIKQADLEKEKHERWWLPSFDLYGSYDLYPFREREYEGSSDRREGVVGARISISLFDGHRSELEASVKSLQIAGLKAEKAQTTQELKAAFENAKTQLALTHQLIHRSENSLKIATEYLRQTLDEYQKGVKNSPDVLSALEKHLSMQLSFVELRRNYELAKVGVMAILGR